MTQRQEPSALGRIVELVRDLRNRCAWDAAQTAETLRPYLVEEVLELDHALGTGNQDQIRVELGDLLLHLAFQIVLGEESGAFGAEDLTQQVERKMWRRHPHLYGDRTDTTNGPQAHPGWERTKLEEHQGEHSVLDGLPPTLPALIMAHRLQEKAAGVGFDWEDAEGPRAKVAEELAELDQELHAPSGDAEGRRARVEAEIGDLLFAVVNLARKVDCDARAALERANDRFSTRFRAVEHLARDRGIELGRAPLEALDALWNEVKQTEKA